MSKAKVEVGGDTVLLTTEDRLTFGRARKCTICLDPEDVSISRIAGAVEFKRGTWWIVNASASRPLALVDDLGFRSVLPPRRRVAVESRIRVVVDGSRSQHNLWVEAETGSVETHPAEADDPSSNLLTGASTVVGGRVLITAADRQAMVALFAGYLHDPPRYDPNPRSYAAAAARLGCNRTALVKRIEYLRKRLDAAGVPNMMGFNALTNLAEYAISSGLITRRDLRLLRS